MAEEVVSTDQSENRRNERSTIEFPYLDLDDAVSLAKAVHKIGGTSCHKEQLAAHFQQQASGGGFNQRLATGKMFGLLTQERGTVTLTDLGIRISDPQQERAARVDSFMLIPLYKAVYERFKGATLPPPSGLESTMGTMGVAAKQKEKARQVFVRSAKQAGFFEFGTDRLVPPTMGQKGDKPASDKPTDTKDGGGRTRKDDEVNHHPFIQGLLKTLPDADTEWTIDARKKWLQAAANIFDLIYTDSTSGSGVLSIEIRKGGTV